MTARFAGVTSIAAPIGVCSAMPRSPLPVVISPTSVWVQCWLGDEKDVDERAEQVADVGRQEIQRVERDGNGQHARAPAATGAPRQAAT